MKYILKNKLPNIKQDQRDWCIPASIEISLKYLQKDFNVSQQELWDLLDGQQPSFGIYNNILSNLVKFDSFIFEQWGPGEPEDFKKKIETALINDFPVLISTPVNQTSICCHIRVCHAIKDNKLLLHDPGNGEDKKERIVDIIKATKKYGGGDILIVSLKGKT